MKAKLILSRRSLTGLVFRAVAIGAMVMSFVTAPMSVPAAHADTTTSAGGVINATIAFPAPGATPSCSVVTPSTHTPTALVAAASTPRLALYVINSSTLTMSQASAAANAATRPPDEWIMFGTSLGSAGTAGVGPTIPNLPKVAGLRLRGLAGTSTTEAANAESTRMIWQSNGVPQGAVYILAESTGSTIDVQAKVTVCDFQSQ